MLPLTSAVGVRRRLTYWIAGFAPSDTGNEQAQLCDVKPPGHEPITDDQPRSAVEMQSGRLCVVSRQRCAEFPPVSFDVRLESIGIDPGLPQHFSYRARGVEFPAGADQSMMRGWIFFLQHGRENTIRGVG